MEPETFQDWLLDSVEHPPPVVIHLQDQLLAALADDAAEPSDDS
jgi:hypothetical protein